MPFDGSVAADGGIADAGDCGVGPAGESLDLRCTGLYSDWATKTVSPSVQEFTPGLQLWSDGAVKTRYIQLPPGTQIDTSNMDEWTFPVGTKLWKEFKLPIGSSTTPVRIETRLLWKQDASNWYRTTYRWSDDGETSALELTAGELDANGDGYEVPSQAQCKECHAGRLDNVLGFEAVGLSAPGTAGVTMQGLIDAGLLTAPPSSPIVIPGTAAEVSALGWMHVNCGTSCHNQGNGLANTYTPFMNRLDVATLSTVQTTDTYKTGWNQPTMTSIPGVAMPYLIHACDVAESAAYYRPAHREGVDGTPNNVQMPPIDTHVVEDAGLAIIAAWINEGCVIDSGTATDSGGGGGRDDGGVANDGGGGSSVDTGTSSDGASGSDGTVSSDSGSAADGGTSDNDGGSD